MGDLGTQNAEFSPGSERQRRRRKDLDYPGLLQSFVLIAVLVVALALLSFVELELVSALGFDASPGVGTGFATALAIVCAVLWGCRRTGAPLPAVLRFAAFPPRLVAPLLVFTFGASIVISEMDNLLRAVWPMPSVIREMFLDVMQPSWGNLVAVVLLAPLTEELLFRGLILRGLIAQRGVWSGVLYSSLLFGLIHLNPWQFAGAFPLGIMLGWLFVQSRSLLPCIFLHAAFNALSFANLAYAESWGVSVPGYTGLPFGPTVFQPPAFDLLGLLLVLGSLVWMGRIFERDAKRAARGPRFSSASTPEP